MTSEGMYLIHDEWGYHHWQLWIDGFFHSKHYTQKEALISYSHYVTARENNRVEVI